MLVPLDSVLTVPDVTTHDASGGAAAADAVTFDVLGAADTPVLGAQPMQARAGLVGVYGGGFPLQASAGFAVGQTYSVVVTATVGGITAHRTQLYFRVGPPEASPGVVSANALLVDGKKPDDVAALTTAMCTYDTQQTAAGAHAGSVVGQIVGSA